ncbi:MAG: methionyl aminopeptidase [bacterium]
MKDDILNTERNEPCWCNSGVKYKFCHMKRDEQFLKPLKQEGYIIPKKHLILNENQIQGIKKCADLTRDILDEVESYIRAGVSTLEINDMIHELVIKSKAIPAPLNYNNFPKSCCTSINNVVCHGIPSNKDILQNGDILNIDVTNILDGYYADMSRMYKIGEVSEEAENLIKVTRECLLKGIEEVKPYTPINNIANTINKIADDNNYSVVKSYCGHGVGLKFHEEPEILHYRTNKKGMVMLPNMVFTIEPMINIGDFDCYIGEDRWTAYTNDGSLSAQMEHTILVTEEGYEILTI